METTVGFVGLGKMGLGMAGRLLDAGFIVQVFNRTASRCESLVERGAVACASPAEAAAGADVVVSMVADDAALREVTLGAGGICAGLAAEAIHLSMSTVSTEITALLALEHQARSQEIVAGPVMGRPDVAAAGTLWILAAGPERLEERCKPLFAAMGRGHTWLGGEPTVANACKIAVNFLLFSMIDSIGQAFTAVEKAGGDRARFLEIAGLLYTSGSHAGYGGRMIRSEYLPGGFTTALALKDVELMLKLVREIQSPAPIASVVRDRLLASVAQGRGEWDVASLVEITRAQAGLTLDT